jgi:molybdate transport system ATP-binding protein
MLKINIKKELNHFTLNINKNFELNKIYGFFGKSGSGKSTFFKIIAGLIKSKGIIKFNEELWQDKNYYLPPQKREVGYVPQDSLLCN